MHCPRCGHRNEPGDRFCSGCGSSLRESAPAETEGAKRSLRDRVSGLQGRVSGLIGTTRGQRLASAGTLVAVAVAVVAFIALPAADDDSQDPYTLAADEICIAAKQQIAAARPIATGEGDSAAARRYAADIVPVLAAWRSALRELEAPGDRAGAAAALDEALLDALVEFGALARTPRGAAPESVPARAAAADEASGAVEDAIGGLDLDRCGAVEIAPRT